MQSGLGVLLSPVLACIVTQSVLAVAYVSLYRYAVWSRCLLSPVLACIDMQSGLGVCCRLC